jgi:hypothetical protein
MIPAAGDASIAPLSIISIYINHLLVFSQLVAEELIDSNCTPHKYIMFIRCVVQEGPERSASPSWEVRAKPFSRFSTGHTQQNVRADFESLASS